MARRKSTDPESTVAVVEPAYPDDSLGARYETQLEAARIIEAGLPFSAIAHFQRASVLTLDRIKQVARLSEGSFARRKRTGHLSSDESERLLRVSRLFELAVGLFDGDRDGARLWLDTPIPSLNDHRPLDLAQTEPGAREVEDLIGRISHGVVS